VNHASTAREIDGLTATKSSVTAAASQFAGPKQWWASTQSPDLDADPFRLLSIKFVGPLSIKQLTDAIRDHEER